MEIAGLVGGGQRAQAGARATHALVIGVSQYRHLTGGAEPSAEGEAWEMEQLSTAAGSASEIAAWLATDYYNPDAPLGTLRLLISPSNKDAIDPAIAPHVNDACCATRANVEAVFKAFVKDCNQHRDNIAIVYIVGHGVQLTKHDAIVLLEDVGAPGDEDVAALRGAIDAGGCFEGMNHDAAPATQFWFVDACRQVPDVAKKFESMEGAFRINKRPGAAGATVCFLAASTRERAFGVEGGRSLLTLALKEALTGSALSAPNRKFPYWHVGIHSLTEALRMNVAALAEEGGEEQTVEPLRGAIDAVFQRFERAPRATLHVEIDPVAAGAQTSAMLHQGAQKFPPPAQWPFSIELEAGLYNLHVTTKPPYQERIDTVDVFPPSSKFVTKVRG